MSGFDTNDEGFQRIVGLFLSELPDRIGAMRQACEHQEIDKIRRLAHQMKGAAGCYGFDDLSIQAARLQIACDMHLGFDRVEAALGVLASSCEALAAERPEAAAPSGV